MTENSDETWYLLRNQQRLGPMTSASLRELASKGMLLRTDLVWAEGLADWIPAERSSALPDDAWKDQEPPPLPQQAFPTTPPPLPKDFVATGRPVQVSSTDATTAHKSGYLLSHWRGQLSLPISFWFNGFLGYVLTTLSVTLIGASALLRTDFFPALFLISLTATWAFTLAVLCWQVVGTWRAASTYGARGSSIFWPAAAKVSLCVATLFTLSHFVSRGLPKIREAYGIYTGDEKVGKYAFRILRDGTELEFSGGIAFGAAKDLAKFVETMGDLRTIHLNSQGGRIEEAQRMGDLIRKHHLDTYVVNACLSACTILFLSGHDRFVGSDAKIGFHQTDFAGLTQEERDVLARKEERRLMGFGLSLQFARHANEVPPGEIWTPSIQELIAEKVATAVADPSKFALSGFGLKEITPDTTDNVMRSVPTYQAIARTDSGAYQEIRAQLFDGLRKGRSTLEISRQVEPIISKLFDRTLPHASPAALEQYTAMIIRHMRLLNRDDPAFCYAYLNPQLDAANTLSLVGKKYPEIPTDQTAIRISVFNSYQREIPSDPDKDEVDASLAKVFKSIDERFSKNAGLIREPSVDQENYSAYCNMMAAFYEEILLLPPDIRTATLRDLFNADE